MIDNRALVELFSLEAGVWSIAGIMFVSVWRMWNSLPHVMGRYIEWKKAKAEEKGADWKRLRGEVNELWDECRSLREGLHACEAREVDWMHRAIAAEAKLLGRGEAMQDAQRIVSIEREIDAKKRGDK